MYKITLKKNEQNRLLEGHSWVYANEVAKIEGKGKNGDLASVYSSTDKFIGRGYVNHLSKILVRIISRNENEELNEAFYERKIREANDLRVSLGYDNSYRVVFAEADGLPALIVDKYADVLSVQILSLAMEQVKEIIVNCLVKIFSPKAIYERSDVNVREKEGLPLKTGFLYGQCDTKIMIEENGIKMYVDVEKGQKTGYFLDQKENRYAIRRYAKNKTVLDCFSNSGGFALNCKIAGAKEVTALDISAFAIDNINENAKLNDLSINTVCCDVFEELRKYKRDGKKFDLIILDPPAFCKSVSEVKDAYRGYKDINILAMHLLNKGGILATCSCSHYMTMPLFENMITDAAKESRHIVRYLERRTQSPDHPSLVGSDETLYLKYYILQVV